MAQPKFYQVTTSLLYSMPWLMKARCRMRFFTTVSNCAAAFTELWACRLRLDSCTEQEPNFCSSRWYVEGNCKLPILLGLKGSTKSRKVTLLASSQSSTSFLFQGITFCKLFLNFSYICNSTLLGSSVNLKYKWKLAHWFWALQQIPLTYFYENKNLMQE